jgi:hypothetical protein
MAFWGGRKLFVEMDGGCEVWGILGTIDNQDI